MSVKSFCILYVVRLSSGDPVMSDGLYPPADLGVYHEPLTIRWHTLFIDIEELESRLSPCFRAWPRLICCRCPAEEPPHDVNEPEPILALCQLRDSRSLEHIKTISSFNQIIWHCESIFLIILYRAFIIESYLNNPLLLWFTWIKLERKARDTWESSFLFFDTAYSMLENLLQSWAC